MAKMNEAIAKIHCNSCRSKTRHTIVASHTNEGSAPISNEYSVDWSTIYEILKCLGCEAVSVRRRHYFSEWNPGDVEETFYPPRVGRPLPPWKDKLPDGIVAMLEEVYASLQADSQRLAMMGARALIDMVMLKEVGDVGSFAKKLAALEKAGLVSTKDCTVLEAALDVGNAASHRGHRPKAQHVATVMDIVEHLLHATVLQSEVDDLKKATPKRASKKPTN